MIETRIQQARHALPAGRGADAAGTSKGRLATRLWTLLHAPALLRGTVGGAGGVLPAEDDRWRLAGRRESTHSAAVSTRGRASVSGSATERVSW